MELYIGNMWWNDSGRTIQTTMTEIKELGINMIRFPIAPQTLDPTDPQGIGHAQEGGPLKNAKSEMQENSRQAMEDFIKLADENDLKVLVDIHSCSNYVGWRAGRLDAAPPYVDAEREDYVYTREDHTCASGPEEYNESKWLANIKDIAGLSESLGVDNIIGIDIFNEPWDYTWAEWKTLAEKAFEAIDSVNPDILIFVEGIGSNTSDETKIPHGADETNPNWGENFYNFKDEPLNIPKERLVLSPHTYGPSVFVQKQFVAGSVCQGMEGDEAGENDCPVEIVPERLYPGWEEHFGYLRSQGYAMVIGEFGGNIDWPSNTRPAEQTLWSHITSKVDLDWQNTFVDYMIEKNIQACYWAINPESGDTGGLYTTPYRAGTNEDAWGTWGAFDSTKTSMIQRYWQGLESK
ncbi:MAG: cellulase family glycosylhydrolase [Deltaproteobacteria bacterium]|nr:cellulase family glycosylhydrolase [Deltaproteobacteria bacterium]